MGKQWGYFNRIIGWVCTLSSVNGNIDTRYLVGSVISDVENGNIKGQNIYGPIKLLPL